MVCLYFPRHFGEAEKSEPYHLRRPAIPKGQGRTVMIIDDEPSGGADQRVVEGNLRDVALRYARGRDPGRMTRAYT